ncbi:MAG: hypothetical protein NTZ52_07805 [Chlamydiae bacterium]|nr:hypothetical protein [Chlamydiota bacterium]
MDHFSLNITLRLCSFFCQNGSILSGMQHLLRKTSHHRFLQVNSYET